MPASAFVIANIIIVLMIIVSAMMSASEVAYFSFTKPEIDDLRGSDDSAEQRIARLLEKPRYLLSSILITNNLMNVGVVITAYFITKQIFDFHDLVFGTLTVPGFLLEFLWNVIVVTFFLVLFGEATPKVFATYNKVKIARFMSTIFIFLNRIYTPLNYILVDSTSFLEKKLRRHNAEIDIEEINRAIEITVERKESKQDAKLLKGIVHFGNIPVKQVMRSRTDVAAVDSGWSFFELMKFVRDTGYSRYPVYTENMDTVVGVINIKDLLPHLNEHENFQWQGIIRKPFFIPENKKIDDLLREIQTNRNHLAVVVDEFGGTSGIITLEDILEEVVGDIKDEFDDTAESDFKKIDDKNFLFDGKITLADVCKLIELPADFFESKRGEAETLGGFILELTGRFPKNGDEMKFANYRFIIISISNNRIEKIKVTNES